MYLHREYKRKIALAVCGLLLAALMLSMAYITKEADHDCSHDHCPICAHIQVALRTIDQLGSLLTFGFIIAGTVFIICPAVIHLLSVFISCTPVSLSIRMNN